MDGFPVTAIDIHWPQALCERRKNTPTLFEGTGAKSMRTAPHGVCERGCSLR